MDFQISPLRRDQFTRLFDMTDADLTAHQAVRETVTESPGTPCRVSLADAEVGESVILVNYTHQPEQSPYQSSHAVYIREMATEATLNVNEVPPVILTRLISLRAFDADAMMVEADVVDGTDVQQRLRQVLDNPTVAYVHIHFAKPGCFAATARRVT